MAPTPFDLVINTRCAIRYVLNIVIYACYAFTHGRHTTILNGFL
jgi:hypothetical protein